MRMTIIALGAALLLSTAAQAQTWNSQNFGDQTFYNGTSANGDSWTGTAQSFGNFTTSTFVGSQGQTQNCTSVRLGSIVTTSCN